MSRLDITFDSHNTKCSAWLYLPESAGPHPVIVMGHGLGAVRTMRLDAYAERFHDAGYACLVFDYRYFGDSEGEPRQLIDVRRQLQDWSAAVEYARSREDLDPDRVVLWGTSFGGGHAITTASRDPRTAAAIAQCPFTDGIASMLAISPRTSLKVTANAALDLVSALRGKPPRRIPIAGPEHSTALMTAPDAMPGYLGLVADGTTFRNEAAARIALYIPTYRPWRRAKDIACPVLFSICETDSVAPPGPTKKAARLAPRGESQVYAAGHFEIYTGEAFEEAIGDQLEFLGRHVPTRRTG